MEYALYRIWNMLYKEYALYGIWNMLYIFIERDIESKEDEYGICFIYLFNIFLI
jgi:hypothetical protein